MYSSADCANVFWLCLALPNVCYLVVFSSANMYFGSVQLCQMYVIWECLALPIHMYFGGVQFCRLYKCNLVVLSSAECLLFGGVQLCQYICTLVVFSSADCM